MNPEAGHVFASKVRPKYSTGAVTAAMYFLVSWVKGRLRSVEGKARLAACRARE